MIKRENYFYGIIILTVIIIRVSVWLIPNININLLGMVIHHFWIGLILTLSVLIIPSNHKSVRLFIFGVGLGLTIDQLVFISLGAGGDLEYWEIPSITGAIILLLLILPFKNKLTKFISSYYNPT